MSDVRIYVEGGGDSTLTKRAVRNGFAGFFRDACGPRRTPKVIPCGGRESAYEDFMNAIGDHPDAFIILLVDAEGPVSAPSAKQHLPWSLAGIDEDQVHLMVQTFEAWVVADADAIAKFYGKGFNNKALPQHSELEAVSKSDLNAALKKATQGTGAKSYHKTKHGPSILAKANAMTVRSKCPSCDKLFEVLAQV